MTQKVCQPTPAAWFDEGNTATIFGKRSEGYLGTSTLIPDDESYYAPPRFNYGKVLIHDALGQVVLRDNLCLHRQAPLLKQRHGVLQNGHVVCPVHKWAYDRKGEVISDLSGFCKESIGSLKTNSLLNFDGYLFSGLRQALSFSSMLKEGQKFDRKLFNMERFARDRGLIRVREEEIPYSALLFDWNYLDDEHIPYAHPKTFAQVADCATLEFEFGENWSMQIIQPRKSIPESSQGKWARFVRKVYEQMPEARNHPFALWSLANPGFMPELYLGHFLAVSYLIPRTPYSCTNVVEYYMSDEAWQEGGLGIKALDEFIAAYRSSADEDDDICLKMQQGLQVLKGEGEILHGPFHETMEQGMVQYLRWLEGVGFNFDVK